MKLEFETIFAQSQQENLKGEPVPVSACEGCDVGCDIGCDAGCDVGCDAGCDAGCNAGGDCCYGGQ